MFTTCTLNLKIEEIPQRLFMQNDDESKKEEEVARTLQGGKQINPGNDVARCNAIKFSCDGRNGGF